MPAETGLTVKTDIAPEISIDYVNRFTQGIRELQKALGITNLIPVAQGGTIKTYKYTSCHRIISISSILCKILYFS